MEVMFSPGKKHFSYVRLGFLPEKIINAHGQKNIKPAESLAGLYSSKKKELVSAWKLIYVGQTPTFYED
jgi:hypothetical protein